MPRTFALVGTGGSSGHTLALVERAIAQRDPGARFVFIDTQPFNLRSGGRTRYDGNGEVHAFSPEACGIRRTTASQTINMLLSGGPMAYERLVQCASRLLDPRPGVVVTCHDRMYAETAVLTAARRRAIPTVLLQEGPFCAIGDQVPRALNLRLKAAMAPLINRARLLPPIAAYGMFDHAAILAASAHYAQKWRRAGASAQTISVTGVPRFDRLAHGPSARSITAGGSLRLLYLSQPFAEHGKVERAAALAALDLLAQGLNLANRQHPIEVVIRTHPRQGDGVLEELGNRLEFAVIHDCGERPIDAAIGEVHATIGHYSTGLLESLIMKRPVICLPIPGHAFAEKSEAAKQLWLEELGVCVSRTPVELSETLSALRQSSGLVTVRWEVLEEEIGIVDARASERAALALLELT
ncbi:hypothetical protein [Novosphingobium album (ex Liu et al. 2023)]|uniref:Polysaccharide biosynthesis protein n=1 Tax=Novosphingobium album (ex Liu et al. 2023) TaxID=3031130 RepID=A0ABT5WTH2_9SPHN|nr:hypothetical protein [Novosphingobium album (ex Liu et al. 2023)]MDE8653184.1 hypothetical protein [Novosphingobium album (ex Liu et al. 2023)]